MSLIKETESYIKDILKELNYSIDNVSLEKSNIPELGQFQLNFSMKLAKEYHKSPIDIAKEVINKFDSRFVNVNIAGPGFINISFSDQTLLDYANKCIENFDINIDSEEPKKIIIDYGGANVAKALHVGHMRSANIGEALKRLAKKFGNEVIGDVHLGDLGRQSGMLISEYKLMNPKSEFFDVNYKGEYPKIDLTISDLASMYPRANNSAKEDEKRMEEVRRITAEIDKGNDAYTNLWRQMINISEPSIKEIYIKLNCNFELWEGELSSMQYVPETIEIMKPHLYESQGALVIDVSEKTDKIDIPPLIVIKSNGATIYSTRELATIYNRVTKYKPDEIWYVVDDRQSLYFEQVFRASYKTNLVLTTTRLKFFGFGTINGTDGKPFKTRDGGVMELSTLISLLREEIEKKVKLKNEKSTNNDEENDIEKIIDKLTIATLKYTDLLSYRKTDYIFDPVKFSSLEGKTGPYVLYGIVRIKSILKKIEDKNQKLKCISNDDVRNILIKVVQLSQVLTQSYKEATLNYITDYLCEITNLFNKFYNDNNIIREEDNNKKETYVALIKLVYNVCHNLLDILAIEEVDKM